MGPGRKIEKVHGKRRERESKTQAARHETRYIKD